MPHASRSPSTISGSDELLNEINAIDGVQLAVPRVQAFALMSFGDRSFGAQLMGVDAATTPTWSSLPGMVSAGRYIEGPGEAFLGSVLARNLGVGPGDEVVMLGTAKQGGVAAAVAISGSGTLAIGGAGTGVVARNTTTNTVEAVIDNGSDIDSVTGVVVRAVCWPRRSC